ncbi:hypothetical protein HII31_02028 [Pseudocercospora fuligena]|uniref:Uncharacterized protein n=1 Tax=Pseudocercospora fuligena TaxID=685502 RepID=A0A8H6RTL1_9PEZI|nr:hypothetical protein HII31_02028 [Pseudocercospora fuligena]
MLRSAAPNLQLRFRTGLFFFLNIIRRNDCRTGTHNSVHGMKATDSLISIIMALSAGHRVVNITELLEDILLRVVDAPPPWFDATSALRTTLLSQRTCRAFRDVILGSTKLRQRLFLSPPRAMRPGSSLNPSCYNPLLRNPLFHGSDLPQGIHFYVGHVWFSVCMQKGKQLRVEFKRRSFNCCQPSTSIGAGNSWRAMYACNVKFEVSEVRLDGKKLDVPKEGLKNPTMGELFDLAFAEK